MKKLRVQFLLLLLFAGKSQFAQSSFYGSWEGKIQAGIPLRLAFHFTKDIDGKTIAILESPDQGSQKIRADIRYLSTDSIGLEVPQLHVIYSGKLHGDSLIRGTFTQGTSMILDLNKTIAVLPTRRPQTPIPPFPYDSREITFYGKDSLIRYGGTITSPRGNGTFPAILLISGSGQQNRDEEIAGHKSFAVLADHLTRLGYIVLRTDDRGIGKTTGDFRLATSADFAVDAMVAIEYLLKQPATNRSKVGIIGHSEGGMIAQIVSAKMNDIAFVIMLAGPGTKVIDLMLAQNEAILKKAGLQHAAVESYSELYENIIRRYMTADSANGRNIITTTLDEWLVKTPSEIRIATTGIHNDSTKNVFINAFLKQLEMPWFRYFLSYDPSSNLLK